MSKFSCDDCTHCDICKYKEDYQTYISETMNDIFDMKPDFMEISVSCKYYEKIKIFLTRGKDTQDLLEKDHECIANFAKTVTRLR